MPLICLSRYPSSSSSWSAWRTVASGVLVVLSLTGNLSLTLAITSCGVICLPSHIAICINFPKIRCVILYINYIFWGVSKILFGNTIHQTKLSKAEDYLMHLGITVWSLLAAFWWGDWKRVKQFYPTMCYMMIGALLYLFLYGGDSLWNEIPDMGLKNKINILLYVFIVFPCTVLLYLSNYPITKLGQFFHISKWIAIYSLFEWLAFVLGRLSYNSGWSIWWSIAFDCMMFPMLRIHYLNTKSALLLSVPIILFLAFIFKPNLD
jgi:hypothetical protein